MTKILFSTSVRKKQVLKFIKEYYDKNNYSPILSEIGEHLGLSRQRILTIVEELVRDGLLEKTDESVRNIRIIDKG